MSTTVATQLKVATAVGLIIAIAGAALGLATDLGLTALWLAIAIGTPLSLALEHHFIRRQPRSRAASQHDHRDALA